MRLRINLDHCRAPDCTNKDIVLIRCLVYMDEKDYQGYCQECAKTVTLLDSRDYYLSPEQAQLEIIKARL